MHTHTTQIVLYVLLALALVLAGVGTFNYLRQRRTAKRAEREGLVLYATVLASTPVGGLMKYLDMQKMTLQIQEPNQAPREVSFSSRTQKGQKITRGNRLIVIVDPTKPDRIYPASPEAAKRVVLTGTRQEQKLMKAQLKNPRRFHQRTQTGYMPPIDKIR